jgi:hypothetical protein
MIRATRRAALAGALALPAAASLAKSPRRKASGTILLHDPSLAEGHRFAAAAGARGDKAVPIEGDRIRFARAVFGRTPALVIGVSRSADRFLIEDVGREAGYLPLSAETTIFADLFANAKSFDCGQALGWVLSMRL